MVANVEKKAPERHAFGGLCVQGLYVTHLTAHAKRPAGFLYSSLFADKTCETVRNISMSVKSTLDGYLSYQMSRRRYTYFRPENRAGSRDQLR
jgi:hypothetical protein